LGTISAFALRHRETKKNLWEAKKKTISDYMKKSNPKFILLTSEPIGIEEISVFALLK